VLGCAGAVLCVLGCAGAVLLNAQHNLGNKRHNTNCAIGVLELCNGTQL